MASSCSSLTLASDFIACGGFCRQQLGPSCRIALVRDTTTLYSQKPLRSTSVSCRAQDGLGKDDSLLARRNAIAAAVLAIGLIGSEQSAFGGILSGSSGLESSEPPITIPQPDFLKKIADAQKQKYEQFDENFKSSPLLQQLLKKSDENRDANKAAIQNKYCQRGAEWGVGDCSLQGLGEEDRAAFFKALQEAQAQESK